jgi:hypothetical protein
LGVEEIAGNSLKLFGRNGIEMSEERVEIAFMAMMEIASSEVEGKLFPIVTGNGKLTFQLALGLIELLLTEGLLHQTV